MRIRSATLFVLAFWLAAAGTSVHAQAKVRRHAAVTKNVSTGFHSISAAEVALLIEDVAANNPKALEKLSDPANRKKQLDNLRDLLAYASQAEKEGLAADPINKQELENLRAEITAIKYDKEINKKNAAAPPFSAIADARVTQYWAKPGSDAAFESFLNTKIAILHASDPSMRDRQITPEEKEQARDIFARTQIYLSDFESARKNGTLPKRVIDRVDLQVKLQQAQMLARVYADEVATKTAATDQEIAAYIASHPDLDTSKRRILAQEILERAKAGDDFAELADRYTEDPGNEGEDGSKNGGLYKDVPLGRMVQPFETAALGLKDGEVASELVESDFGYHIIKLERKGEKDGKMSYDVRHILIATTVPNASDPMGRAVPLKDYVRGEVENDKEQELLRTLIISNGIVVPADFKVPAVPATPAKATTRHSRRSR
jgi:parvulin-like peptidyl-prolyl isomerase